MIYMVIAVALCLLVPSLPCWVYRRMPQNPSPPMSEAQLQRLAMELHRQGLEATDEEVLVSDDSPNPNIMPPNRFDPDAPHRESSPARRVNEERQNEMRRIDENTQRETFPRLAIPSYRRVNVVLAVSMSGMLLVFSAPWAAIFNYLGEYHARSFQEGVFVFKPYSYAMVCMLPAVMLGVCTAGAFIFYPARLLLGRDRFQEYLYWEDARAKSRGASREQVLKNLSGVLRLLRLFLVLYVWQTFNWYARVEEDGIAVKRIFSFSEQFYPYSSVERITLSHLRSRGTVTDLHIYFHDGQMWETDDCFYLPLPPERDRLLDFLSRKTGKKIMLAQSPAANDGQRGIFATGR